MAATFIFHKKCLMLKTVEIGGNITDRPVEDGHLPVSNGVDALKSPFPLIYQTSHILHCFMCSTHPCIITEEKNKLYYDHFEIHTHIYI